MNRNKQYKSRIVSFQNIGTDKTGHKLIEILCSCGNLKIIRKEHYISERILSCGCLHLEVTSKLNLTHGHNRKGLKTITYSSWQNMNKRCNNLNSIQFKDYGGRGIKICKRWEKFENFLQDMGERPSKIYSIDRINVNGNYCKSNCKWSTQKEQANNRRKNK